MNDQSQNFTEQGAAFQKIWLESMSRLMQAAFTFSPNAAPPELMREIRNGILKALGETWNEFLRSPQFQESMKQFMDNAVAFRKFTNEYMSKVHKEMQTPSRDDIDALQLNVRHLETRLLSRLEELAKQVDGLKQQNGTAQASPTRSRAGVRPPPAQKASRQRPAKQRGPEGKL